uniref:Uncharacterized protein n=1 Tax=Russula abietina TaxID=482377 RepID=A0A2S0U3P2_9AGAM|nr:hypothetical protein [Russula abietina]AWB36104.1 hypothetical protein [Russula abietina]
MNIIPFILLFFIIFSYIFFGYLITINLLGWLLIFIICNNLIWINPNDKNIQILRNVSIMILISIIYKIWLNSNIHISSLLFFYLYQIDFLDFFEWKHKKSKNFPKIYHIQLVNLTNELINLLNSLEEDKNYYMSLAFTPSYNKWKDKKSNAYYKKI